MLELKVRKFGKSLGVLLPKEVVNRLRTEEGGAVFLVETTDGGYRLMPYNQSFERKMVKAEDIMRRYRNTLQVLSK